MRKTTIALLILVSLLNYSCKNTEVEELKKQISDLELKNKILQDSLNKYDEYSIINSLLIGIPELRDYKVNETGIINFGFLKYGEIRKYNVYQKIKGTEDKKLLYSNLTEPKFKFEFTPKSIDDNEVELITEFESLEDGKDLIHVFTTMHLNVIK
jgi:hypothetical protein